MLAPPLPLLAMAGALMMLHGRSTVVPGGLLLVFALAGTVQPLASMVHELGHAAAAWGLGMRVVQVTVGRGPMLVSGRLGATLFEARRYLFLGGATLCFDPAAKPRRWRIGLTLLGGIAANLVAAALGLLGLLGLTGHRSQSAFTLALLCLAILMTQLLCAILNFLPQRSRTGHGRSVSDGWLLLALIRAKDYATRAMEGRLHLETMALLARGRCEEARRLCEEAWRAKPGGPLLLLALIEATAQARGRAAALQRYCDLESAIQASGPEDRMEAAALRAKAAWYAILSEDSGDMPLAERLSRQALEARPADVEFRRLASALAARRGDLGARSRLLDWTRAEPIGRRKVQMARLLGWLEGTDGESARAAEWERLADFLDDDWRRRSGWAGGPRAGDPAAAAP
jgi:hypothetical protein